ncbi:MAG TPA: amino acid permease [Gemmatimonadales bacterium]|nr:amino acid permease [Gemmatimonadales bacterium]
MTAGIESPTSVTDPELGNGRLPRRLGAWSTAAVTVGIMIGSGVFRVPAAAAAQTGTPGAMLLTWVVGALVALCGALALAEVAALFPRAGGMYVYLREAYGPLTAFLFGWVYLIIIPTGAGAIALVFAEYLSRLVPLSAGQVRLVAAGLIVLLGAAQYRSVRFGAAIQNVSTAAKVLAIVALVLASFALSGTDGAWAPGGSLHPVTWGGFGLGVVTVLWAYNGWQDVTCLSGEVLDPRRALPRALVGGTFAVALIYLLLNAAYLHVLPLKDMAASPLVAADVAVRLVGPAGSALVAALVCVSTFGSLNAVMMAIPRVFWAMADDGLFFRFVAAVHPRYRTPHMAISSMAVLGVVYLALQSFEQLIEAFILASLPFWALSVASVFVFRHRRPDAQRVYRTPGYPVIPFLFVTAMVMLLANSLYARPEATVTTLAAVFAGVPLYYWWRARGRPSSAGPVGSG